ncbi:hypothetical protein ARMGADRAFT_1030502 [Armillaria gallica]|uniref:Uncharacterized protein n=1 Tax=Armillaria gallica TaxID=47427 RepID=A0A2H3DNM2_ARMGA|nr:hypothetical protein ARMGADRAFT_1030502 [Armillaria gallica]
MSSLHERRQCPHCQKYFHVNGIGNYRKTCKQRIQQDVIDSQFDLETSQRQAAGMDHGATNTPMLLFGNQVPSLSTGLTSQFHDLHLDNQGDLSPTLSFESVSSEAQNPSSAPVTNATDQILDFVNSYNPKFIIEYHPRALLDPCILTREEYFQITAVEKTDSFVDNLNCPWHPFASKNDFELAEHILCTRLNGEGRDGFFKVLKTQARDHPSAFTINNDHDLKEAWSKAENLLTKVLTYYKIQFKKETLALEYQEEIQKYDVYFRPLWNWTLNLLSDKTLSPFFVWDAMKIFQLDENTNTKIRIFDEPWTGDLLWEIQSSLPPGGKPLAYILYADKTRLSSFGTEKGYLVVACIANLPDVEDDSRHKGKLSWINFKRVVWHEAFRRIIQSVAEYSHTGYAFKLPHSGDIIIIYPFIFILSADYEEHCMMTLIHGNKSAHPCPKYIFHGQQKKCKIFIIVWKKREKMFYKKLVYDLLKMYSGALLKVIHIKQFPGIGSKVAIDEFIANFPRWRNLMHFKNVTDFDFGDAKKFEHMSKAYSQAIDNKGFEKLTTWKIPQVHTQQHLFDDIIAKGVTKNYNTKPNECMHGPLKKTYQTQTSFKDVAEQIHEKIDCQKKYQQEETDDLSEDKKNQCRQNQRIGALDSKAMLHSLKFTPKNPRTVAEGEFIQYMPHDIIRIHQTLTVTYQSLVNLKESADLLRCSPSFYNEPRYDGVMINTDKGAYIGQLIQLFEFHPFDVKVTDGGQRWKFQRDKDLGFYCLHAHPQVFSQFVSIYSIIRGVLLVEDSSSDLSNGQD